MNELLPIYVLYKLIKSGKSPKSGKESDLIDFLKENSNEPEALKAAAEFDADPKVIQSEDFTTFVDGLRNPNAEEMRNGGKVNYLKKLDAFKKGGKVKAKKCKCGCDIIAFKEKGGKISEKCSCNCKGGSITKKEIGGNIIKNIDMKVKPTTKENKFEKVAEFLKCGGKMKKKKEFGGKVEKDQKGAKVEMNRFSKPGEKPTAADTISKYNRMNVNSDGKGPLNEKGKELNNKSEILNAARKEWKGKKVDVKKSENGGKVDHVAKLKKLNLTKKK